MDVSQLQRNPDQIKQNLKALGEDKLITKEGCKIYIPQRYQEQNLAKVGSEVYTLAIFAIVVGDKYYGVSKAPSMTRLTPDTIRTVTIGEDEYLELVFEKGSVVMPNTNLVNDDTLLYYIYNEYFAKGKVPWYINYRDLGSLFEHAKDYTGTSLGANHVVTELITAAIARDNNDKTKFYRHVVDNVRQIHSKAPVIVPLKSVTYGASNTTAKLIGAYWDEGVTSALVNPSDKTEPIEEILRR